MANVLEMEIYKVVLLFKHGGLNEVGYLLYIHKHRK